MQRIFRLFTTAMLQLFCNILKAIFYVHILLQPDERYQLPAFSRPLWPAKADQKIPNIIWQTNYTDRVTLSVYANYWLNRLMAPRFEYRICNDDDCAKFVESNFPGQTYDCYARLQIGAAKADFWRVLMLLKTGGVYLDLDATLTFPLGLTLAADQTELFLRYHNGMITNHFIAAAPGNATLDTIRRRIEQNIMENASSSVFNLTGPRVFNKIVAPASNQIEDSILVCKQGLMTSKRFQYPDKGRQHWQDEQKEKPILK